MTHFFSFPAPDLDHLNQEFDSIFHGFDPQIKDIIPEGGLFEKTNLFQNPLQNNNKISLSTSDPGVLRMISHAISLHNYKFAFSYVGESAQSDNQFTYFKDNSQKNSQFICTLGEQIHLSPEKKDSPLNIRLGALRRDIQAARLYIADSTFLFFNINALKWSDSPAQSGNNPSGLTSEEANQLAFMAGQSHKNKVLILYGFNHFDHDPYGLSMNSAMQILWYYQHGSISMPQPWPIPEERQQDFTIESTLSTRNLLFRKDRLTSNWFHKIPFDLPPDLEYHQWIASSHDEYLATANEDPPLRLLEWYDLPGI